MSFSSINKKTLPLILPDIAYEGAALGRHDGQVIFAAYGIPGEEVLVEIQRQRRDYGQGRVVQVLSSSPYRVEPPCPYFGVCGGCQLQHIAYAYQLEAKAAVMRHQLRRLGKFSDPLVQQTIGATTPASR